MAIILGLQVTQRVARFLCSSRSSFLFCNVGAPYLRGWTFRQ